MKDKHNLSTVPMGHPIRLAKIKAGRRLTHRLTELGLTPGVEFSIIQDNGGPLLIEVRGSRIAIGREMARKIQVTPINSGIPLRRPSAEMSQAA